MPIARTETRRPPRPFTITHAQVAGLTPDQAHEAILAAIDLAVITVTDTADINPTIIDGAVATLAGTRRIIKAHAPYSVWCFSEGTDGPHWPCPTYREAAATIADGLGQ